MVGGRGHLVVCGVLVPCLVSFTPMNSRLASFIIHAIRVSYILQVCFMDVLAVTSN